MVVPAKGFPRRQESPYPRNDKGARPWSKVISKPRTSLSIEAFRKVLEATDDGELSKKDMLLVLTSISEATAKNVLLVRQELVDGMNANNKRCEQEIKSLVKERLAVKKQAQPFLKTYTSSCAKVGMTPKLDGGAEWDDNEPKSLAELAGQHKLPDPTLAKPEDYDKLTGVFGSIAQGCMFALGILLMKGISLENLGDNIGIVLFLVSLCSIIAYLLAQGSKYPYLATGDHLGRWEKVRDTAIPVVVLMIASASSLMAGFLIETVVDGFGFLKMLTESSSTESVAVPPHLVWVLGSFVSYPVLSYYAKKYLYIGYYRAMHNRLIDLQKELRKGCDQDAWNSLLNSSAELKPLLKEIKRIEEKIESLRGEVRYEFTKEELNRLEDLDEAAFSVDLAILRLGGIDEAISGKAKPIGWKRTG